VSAPDHHGDREHSVRGARTNFLTLLGQATSFLFGAAAARLFGQASWGAYTTAYAWVDVLTRSSLFAGDKAALVFVPARRTTGDEPGAVRALATSLRIAMFVSILCAAGMFVASYPIASVGSALDGTAMRLLALVILPATLSLLLLAATMASKVLIVNFIAKGIVEPLLMLALAVVAGITYPWVGALALIPVVVSLAVLAVAFVGVRRFFDLRAVARSTLAGPVDREVLRFTVPLAASEFLNIVAMRLGSFVLIAYAVAEERAVFNTCVLLASTVSYVRGAFDTVLGPIAAEAWAHQDHERLARNLREQSSMVILFAVPLASVFIVGGAAVLSAYGSGFAEGHRTLVWLALGHMVNSSLGLVGWVLLAAQRSGAMLKNNIVKVLVELVLCLCLIPPLGIEGAAIATLVAITALHGLQVFEVWRLAGIHPFSQRMLRLVALGAVVIVGELALYRFVSGTPIVRTAIALAVGMPLYFGVAWRWRVRKASVT
jgi:O-antigen/teichoic acid export membrane protein